MAWVSQRYRQLNGDCMDLVHDVAMAYLIIRESWYCIGLLCGKALNSGWCDLLTGCCDTRWRCRFHANVPHSQLTVVWAPEITIFQWKMASCWKKETLAARSLADQLRRRARPTISIDCPMKQKHRDVGAFNRYAGGVPILPLEVLVRNTA
jgi:hypothetical protein